ncbi:type VII toxin-antitoxin system MntA family adenylyltransferase antitoxin [Natronosalvus caseinilyticus]|uniref:type VII toxin-antitoxin system MntA family adenylyltransferase antitoxin n=1 Tax=Natronosalvus caseinilyticus TaxID=2953747 RepID=UPI0028AA3B85|nr:nucleotidyltransferase domain-containing protein [Natronosalvus caseinilyticus]
MGPTPPSDTGSNTPLEREIDLEELTCVLEGYPVRLAILFGSTVHGTATDQSDIDIAVAFESDLDPTERLEQRISLIVSLTDALETDAIDVADLEGINSGIGLAALENGYVLVDNPALREHLKEKYEGSYPEGDETHEERMRRFDSLLSRLEGRV